MSKMPLEFVFLNMELDDTYFMKLALKRLKSAIADEVPVGA